MLSGNAWDCHARNTSAPAIEIAQLRVTDLSPQHFRGNLRLPLPRQHHRRPVIDGRPFYACTQLVLVDVTEMKSAEHALAAERERLSVTLRAMSEAVVTIDQGGVIQFMNDAAAELTGWPAAAAIGHPLREVCVLGPEKPGQALPTPVASAMTTDHPFDLPPYTLIRPRAGAARCVEGR